MHSGKRRPADGQGSRHHPGLAGFPWAPGPGREPGLCSLAARGARGWLALGSWVRPAASGAASTPLCRVWVTGARQGGSPGEGLRLDVGMRQCQPSSSWQGGWELGQRLRGAPASPGDPKAQGSGHLASRGQLPSLHPGVAPACQVGPPQSLPLPCPMVPPGMAELVEVLGCGHSTAGILPPGWLRRPR